MPDYIPKIGSRESFFLLYCRRGLNSTVRLDSVRNAQLLCTKPALLKLPVKLFEQPAPPNTTDKPAAPVHAVRSVGGWRMRDRRMSQPRVRTYDCHCPLCTRRGTRACLVRAPRPSHPSCWSSGWQSADRHLTASWRRDHQLILRLTYQCQAQAPARGLPSCRAAASTEKARIHRNQQLVPGTDRLARTDSRNDHHHLTGAGETRASAPGGCTTEDARSRPGRQSAKR
jgi:hypothetical protein